ncbi:hypothetical protein OAN307_c43090 [Octadecabacter antarcticus 307]|uniref:Uncharacterized protein n=1 Tax=Octadecabacter antarcticus 307 TaxID=391626 RepID=M9RIN4_9RHOB|nr:hypothetical protein [Octadecabacter antarcticus]AGI69695.1 hypothetical protein OAN307_c43090 [Octadecabacter antarcticus 307]
MTDDKEIAMCRQLSDQTPTARDPLNTDPKVRFLFRYEHFEDEASTVSVNDEGEISTSCWGEKASKRGGRDIGRHTYDRMLRLGPSESPPPPEKSRVSNPNQRNQPKEIKLCGLY